MGSEGNVAGVNDAVRPFRIVCGSFESPNECQRKFSPGQYFLSVVIAKERGRAKNFCGAIFEIGRLSDFSRMSRTLKNKESYLSSF